MNKLEALEIAYNSIGVEIEEYETVDVYIDELYDAQKIIKKEIEELKKEMTSIFN